MGCCEREERKKQTYHSSLQRLLASTDGILLCCFSDGVAPACCAASRSAALRCVALRCVALRCVALCRMW